MKLINKIKDPVYWFLRNHYVEWAKFHNPRRLADILYHDVFISGSIGKIHKH